MTRSGSLTSVIGERRTSVRFPAGRSMEAHVRGILSGDTYPAYRLPIGPDQTIVDIGANVGAASVYFLGHAPQARLLAFEPCVDTARYLQANLRPFARAEVVPAGLFSHDVELPLHQGVQDCCQNSVVPSCETAGQNGRITLRRASEELARCGVGDIAILKIDTEGCEVPILTDLAPWLPRTDRVYLEYHSEEDRLALDGLLASWFVLCRARCDGPHRGVNFYIARRIMEADPRCARLRLVPPQ